MCRAIAECHRVDEAQQIKDQARALEVYAMQVKNTEAERQAVEIRLRAERRLGQLLQALNRATPGMANAEGRNQHSEATPHDAERAPTPYARALDEHGISTQSASRYQRLALVPAEEFEQALRAPDKPTTTGVLTLARRATELEPPNPQATWLWARMRDFEAMGLASLDRASLLDSMTPAMQADVRRLAPAMRNFFGAFAEAIHGQDAA
jgi:hypothetical protein